MKTLYNLQSVKKEKFYALIIILALNFSIAVTVNAQNSGITDAATFTPQSLLHIHQNAATGILFQLTNTTSDKTAQTNGFIINMNTNFNTEFKNQYNNSAAGISFFTNNGSTSEKVTIKNDGNVGVGDASPVALFTVGSGDLFQVLSTGHVNSIAGTAALPTYSYTSDNNSGMYSGGADNVRISTGGTDRIIINSSGNVGIGTTDPNTGHLQVYTPDNKRGIYLVHTGANMYGIHVLKSGVVASSYGIYSNVSGANTTNVGGLFTASDATNNIGVKITDVAAAAGSYGLYNDAAAQNYFAGNVGIASTTPGAQLDCNGSAIFNESGADKDFRIESQTNANQFFIDASAGNIGIGTATPAYTMDIYRTAAANGDNFVRINATGSTAHTADAMIIFKNEGDDSWGNWVGANYHMNGHNSFDVCARDNISMRFFTKAVERMRIDSLGNVGIGDYTSSWSVPAALLEVKGSFKTTTFQLGTSTTAGYVMTADASGVGTWQAASGGMGGTGTANYVPRFTAATTLGNSVIYDDGTNVGIGDASPAALFVVGSGDLFQVNSSGYALGPAGAAANPTFSFTGDANTGMYSGGTDIIRFSTNSTDRMSIIANGNVGIGSTTPGYLLDVHNDQNATTYSVVQNNSATAAAISTFAAGSSGGWTFFSTTGGSYTTSGAFVQDAGVIYANTSLGGGLSIGAFHASGVIRFYTNGTSSERMRIASDGNVGIGTTSASNKLDVEATNAIVAEFNRSNDGTVVSIKRAGVEEGTITNTGGTVTYTAFTGSHYAKMNNPIKKGSLVVLNGQNTHLHNNPESEIIYGVSESAIANDSKVMGSFLGLQDPSLPLNNDNPYLIMAVGNGEVWVVDNGENLQIGDYLITSDIKGHAMKEKGDYPVAYIFAKVAEAIDWSAVTETINGKKHKKVSVFYESFVINNDVEDLKKEVARLKAENENLKTNIDNRFNKLESVLGTANK